MDITPTSSSDQSFSTPTATNAFSDIKSEQFIKIMFSELSNQDPLKPNDSNALLQQLSSLRQIQSDMDLGNKLDSLVTQNQLAGASGLIGKFVTGLSEENERVLGRVVSVSRTDNGPVLNLDDGTRVPFGSVDELLDDSLVTPNPGGGS